MPGLSDPTPPAPPIGYPAPLAASETHPEIKRAATGAALALTTYDVGESAQTIAKRIPATAKEAVAEAAQALHRPYSWSRGRIVYPQFGGLQPDRASVMVVVERMQGSPEGLCSESRTLDIRMSLEEGEWRFDRLASDGGQPVKRPASLSPEATAVLDNPRIELPDTARWDIHEGRVSDTLLGLMARAAQQVSFGVIVFDTGHPWEVFGTDRQSDHSRGLAVDLYRIDDNLIIDDREIGSKTHSFVTWLYEQGDVRQIGSPWALDGRGGRSFSDALHQDHIHIGVHRHLPAGLQ